MPESNFEKHNAEVREVWDAYYAREPIRVPCIVGTNTRYFMLGDGAPFGDVDFEEYTNNPDVMFETQVRCQDWSRHNMHSDGQMGLPPEEDGWSVRVDFQNFYDAAWFGCDIHFREGQVPDTLPKWRDDDRKREVIDNGIPDPFGGLFGRVKEYYARFQEKAESYEFKGRKVGSVMPGGLGTDGPLTVAANIRGASEFFMDLIDDAEYATDLLDLVTEASIVRIKAWRKFIGEPEVSDSFGFADDSIQLVSPAMYREIILPFHKRLREALCSSWDKGSVHLCGDSSKHFVTVRDELAIDSFDTGFPIDHGKIRKDLGPDVEIRGGPHIELMRSGTPEAVRESADAILNSGVTEGGRFILREGNNLAPGTPLANINAMYEAAKAFTY